MFPNFPGFFACVDLLCPWVNFPEEIRNGFPLSLHYLLFGKTIGGHAMGR